MTRWGETGTNHCVWIVHSVRRLHSCLLWSPISYISREIKAGDMIHRTRKRYDKLCNFEIRCQAARLHQKSLQFILSFCGSLDQIYRTTHESISSNADANCGTSFTYFAKQIWMLIACVVMNFTFKIQFRFSVRLFLQSDVGIHSVNNLSRHSCC